MAPSIMTDPPPQPPRQQPYHHAAAVELPAQMPIQPGQTQQQRVQIPSHMQQQQQYVHPGYSQPGPMHPQMHPQQAATYQGYYPHQYPSTSYQMPQLPAQAQYSQQSAMPKGMQQPQQMQHQMAYQQQQQQQQMAPTCMQERQNFSHQNMPSTSTYTARSPSRVPHPGPSSHSMPQHHLTQQWMNQHYMGGGGPTASGHASSYASPAPSAAPSVMSAMAANFETMSVLSVNTQMTSATGAIPPPCEDMAVGDIQSPQCFSSNGSNISAVENVNPQLVQQPLIQLRQCVTHFHNARCLGDQIDAFERIYQIIGRSDSKVLPLGVELAVEIFRATYIILHMYATNRYGDIGPNHQRQVEIFRHLIRCAHVIVSLKEFREAPTRFIPLEPSPPVFIQFLAIFLKSTDVSVVEQILYILHELVTKDELKRIYMSKLKDVQLISNLILHIETCRSFRIIHWTGVVLFQLQHGDPMFVRYLMAEDRKPMPLMSAILQKTLPSLREAHQFCAKKYPDREQFNRETRSFGPAAEMMFILIRRLICGTGAQQRNWINLFIQQGGIQIVSYFIQFDDKTFNSIRLLHFVSSDCDPSVLRDMPPEGGPQQMYLVEAFQMILRAIPRMRPSKGLLSAMGFLHNSTLNRTNNKVALIRLGNMKIFTELIQKNSRLENFAHMNEKSWNIGEQRELLSDIIGLISALVLHYGDQKIEETRKHEDADALRDAEFLKSLFNIIVYDKDFDINFAKATHLRSGVFKLIVALLFNGCCDQLLSIGNDINQDNFINTVLLIIEQTNSRSSAINDSQCDLLISRAIAVLHNCIKIFGSAASAQITEYLRYSQISPLEILNKRQSNADLTMNILMLCDEIARFMNEVPQSWINYRSVVESMANNKDIRIANPAQSLLTRIPDMEPLAGFFASDACME